MRSARSWLLVLPLFTGCFESGPLAVATGSLGDDATTSATDTTTAASEVGPDGDDTGAPPDTTVTTTTDAVTDTTAVPPTDTSVASDSAVADTSDATDVEVRACLVNGDCAGVVAGDRCQGVVRCVDYGCRPDPSTAVVCDDAGDPCLDVSCNPATGACETTNTCVCRTDGTLACGQTATFSTSDLGPLERIASYGCGPPAGPWIERLFDFAPAPGRVRLDLQSAGTSGFHVLARAGDQCDPTAQCLAGATSRLYIDATGGPLVVSVDYAVADALVALTATCGITRETECNDGFDDEPDGATDCVDADCNGVGGCPLVLTAETGYCVGGVDDDDDGATDCADSDCGGDLACLETCDVSIVNVGCGFHQGAPTGGGKAKATHYACSADPAGGKEVVYRFRPSFSGTVDVAFSAAPGLALYLLIETGRGCTPRDCLATTTTGLSFQAVEGTTYYLAIDAPTGVTGNFDLHVTCPD